MSQGEIAVSEGNSFAVSNAQGDITPGTAHGLFYADTRFLSGYVMRINGEQPLPLSSRNLDHDSASFYCTNRASDDIPQGWLTIVRDRFVASGLHDDITLVNHGTKTVTVKLDLEFAADFADIFEVRGAKTVKQRVASLTTGSTDFDLAFSYARAEFRRQTLIKFSRKPSISDRRAEFIVTLEPKQQWKTCLSIRLAVDGCAPNVECRAAEFGSPVSCPVPEPIHSRSRSNARFADSWLASLPTLSIEDTTVKHAYDRAISDLAALRIGTATGHLIPAAGLPWYLAIFGRDSIITALQTMLLGPSLAVDVLHCLAHYQARRLDDFRDEQPGKMPHEIRAGELACLGDVPHSRYYGTVDATPLYLILLSETFRWTGDVNLVKRLLPVAETALRWIDDFGDMDGDGFVEYRRRSIHGLVNQGWKDSTDCICFKDGRLAEEPIALAEVQGYVYDAKVRLAEIYHQLGFPARADELQAEASALKARFNQAFWLPEEGYYALALDGEKRPVDSVTSNPGHCLWSGIIAEERAPAVAARLMADDMFSGWGIRTMSALMPSYNPVSYHNGSIWPHDNSIIAAGLRRYGFDREARCIAESLFEASAGFPLSRLPELFAGYPRRGKGFPVEYPGANAPQAWAAGAVISLLRTLLGLQPEGESLKANPVVGTPRLELLGLPFRGQLVDVKVPPPRSAAGTCASP